MMRRKPLPACHMNGWRIEKRPNTFAERWAYEATATDAAGYVTARRGFHTLRDARAYCGSTNAEAEHHPCA